MSERFLQVSGRLSWGFLEGIGRWVKSVWTLSKGFLFLTSTTWSQVAACIPGSFFAHMFVGPCKVTYYHLTKYLFQTQHHFEIINIFIWVVQKFSKKKEFFLVKLSYPLKGFNYLQDFFRFYYQRELEEVHILSSGPRGLCFKIVNFCRTETGLTSKWGRNSPAVYWWHQNQSRYIVRRCATWSGVAKKLADH